MRYAVLAAAVLALAGLALAGQKLVDDRFTGGDVAGRDLSPHRGKWVMDAGVATCTQDDELYKKNRNHGPVIWYRQKFTDATLRFSLKPQGVKAFVFTINNDAGHLFRFVQSGAGTSVRLWKEQGKDAKAVALTTLRDKTPKLAEGQWTPVEVTFDGPRATVRIGDWKQTFEDPAIAREKALTGLGFSFGTLSLKDVSIEAAAK